MPPKKGKKMALNDFLVDETLGSWADEMDNLPSAPTFKTDEDRYKERDGRRDFSNRDRDFAPRESNFPPREELPLPSKPPFIAFVGNLSFDIYEDLIAEFFAPSAVKDIKIIKDRDEKPKGFGYVEFETLDGLKDGLSRSGGQLGGRTCRVSVAEPPKERSGGFDDDRFEGPWRRQGPLPPLPGGPEPRRSSFAPRDSPRDGPGGEPAPPSQADTNNDWRRAARPPPPPPGSDRAAAPGPRRPSAAPTDPSHPAYNEQTWSIGSKFKASPPVSASDTPPQERRSLFGGKGADPTVPSSNVEEVSDWRAAPRRTVSGAGSSRGSPTASTPPTPTLGGRRKLELLPRGAPAPATESPLASPRSANATIPSSKASPFGAARPIDVSNREKEVEQRLEQDRAARAAAVASKDTRGNDKDRSPFGSIRGGPRGGDRDYRTGDRSATASPAASAAALPTSPIDKPAPAPAKFDSTAGVVRPKFSFANAAGGVKAEAAAAAAAAAAASTAETKADDKSVETVTEKVAEVSV